MPDVDGGIVGARVTKLGLQHEPGVPVESALLFDRFGESWIDDLNAVAPVLLDVLDKSGRPAFYQGGKTDDLEDTRRGITGGIDPLNQPLLVSKFDARTGCDLI